MKIKQKNIAEKLNISRGYLSLVMSGKKPISWPLAEKLSEILPGDIKFWKKATPAQIRLAFKNHNKPKAA